MSTWWDWVQRHGGGQTNAAIAKRAGIDASALTRWSKGESPRATAAMTAARGLGRSPIEGLVAAGFVTHDESGQREVLTPISESSDADVFREVQRRLPRLIETADRAAVGQAHDNHEEDR